MSPSDPASAPLAWLRELLDDVSLLPQVERPRPYWSQKVGGVAAPTESWPSVVHRVRGLVNEFLGDHFFAETIGIGCVDHDSEGGSSPQLELGTRVGKPDLWVTADVDWSESDLCDFVEVFHDLAARPTRGWFHDYDNCGFHPTCFSRKSGQALYRWRINRLLEATSLDLRIADDGEDVGRMIRVAPTGVGTLTHAVLDSVPLSNREEVFHAIALYRARGSGREQQRSAIVSLAGVLEQRRALLKAELLRKDEASLFEIANRFDLRHRREDQCADYDDAFLEWIFYWYLATVHLTNQLIDRQLSEGEGVADAAG